MNKEVAGEIGKATDDKKTGSTSSDLKTTQNFDFHYDSAKVTVTRLVVCSVLSVVRFRLALNNENLKSFVSTLF